MVIMVLYVCLCWQSSACLVSGILSSGKLGHVRCLCLQLLLFGVVGQWVVKPLLGISLASTLVPALRLPTEVATGLILVQHLMQAP